MPHAADRGTFRPVCHLNTDPFWPLPPFVASGFMERPSQTSCDATDPLRRARGQSKVARRKSQAPGPPGCEDGGRTRPQSKVESRESKVASTERARARGQRADTGSAPTDPTTVESRESQVGSTRRGFPRSGGVHPRRRNGGWTVDGGRFVGSSVREQRRRVPAGVRRCAGSASARSPR